MCAENLPMRSRQRTRNNRNCQPIFPTPNKTRAARLTRVAASPVPCNMCLKVSPGGVANAFSASYGEDSATKWGTPLPRTARLDGEAAADTKSESGSVNSSSHDAPRRAPRSQTAMMSNGAYRR